MNILEHVIDNEGRFFRRTFQQDEIDPTDALIRSFSAGNSVKLQRALFMEGYGPIGIATTPDGNFLYFSIPLNEIVLKCEFDFFTSNKGPEAAPNFTGRGTQLTIPWSVDQAFPSAAQRPRIIFSVCVAIESTRTHVIHQYLFAIAKGGSAYRMPLSNLYETCEVCNGSYESIRLTAFQSVQAALTQFSNAPWNADLSNLSDKEDVQKFFHFKPLDKGFETLPIAGDWTHLCKKVATPELKYIV
jgi:hypothetical protein